MRNLKGVPAGDLGLAGVDENTTSLGLKGVDDSSGSPGLKGVGDVPGATGPYDTDSIYWDAVSVPAACVIAGELRAGNACAVVDAYHLRQILQGPNPTPAFEKWILEEAVKKVVVISLGEKGENLDRKIDLVKAIYEAEARIFAEVSQRITNEMTDDPAKQEWMKEQADVDSDAIARLRQQIFAERQANVQASADYLRANPNSLGIRFNCTQPCHQLIEAAEGTSVLQ